MSDKKHTGGNALMNLEPAPKPPRKILSFGEAQPPVTQPSKPATQLPEPATQTASPEAVEEREDLGNQIPGRPNTQYVDSQFPSRIQRRQKSIRLPTSKLPGYEDYQHANRHVFRDFQDLVEYALDWVTSQPVTQLPNLPNTQTPTLINKELNNSLSFNEEKAARDMATYTRLTGNPAKPKDWEAYAEVAQVSSAAVEQGIKDAIQRARQQSRPVLGFRWCLFSIQDAARNARTVPEDPKAEIPRLAPEEIESKTLEVVTLLRSGEQIENIAARLAPSMHAGDWARVRSVALAQVQFSKTD